MNRAENIRRLDQEEFDLCILGGGASGAGCALDAALRGLKVALIEKTDFAAETSSRSTKLVHGGVRYLEQAFKKLDFAQLRQVRHGLEERRIVLQNAPHLAHPLGLITPVFSWWEGFYISVGLRLYDWFASSRRKSLGDPEKSDLPPSRWLSKTEALQMMPGLSPRIHSAVLYYDGQLDDARYCLALLQSASEAGAVVANHLEVIGFQKDGNGELLAAIVANQIENSQPFDLKAKQFLNCTGPYADHIRQLANTDLPQRIRPSKGVHLVLPLELLGSDKAMLIPKTRDGRMIFAIPFEGNLLLGTTDEPYSDLEKEPVLEANEVDFLLETLQPFVAQKIEKEQVRAGFGGIRPLLSPNHQIIPPSLKAMAGKKSPNTQTKSLLRDHEVEHDPASHLLSLLGGKWTTYRLMARDAVDAVCRALNVATTCQTERHLLFGAAGFGQDFWKKLRTESGFDEDVCQHLASKYGMHATVPAALAAHQELSERILPHFPFLKAEIVYATKEEMALTIRDFLARRIRLETMDWEAAKQATPIVAQWMGKTLAWSTAEQKARADEYISLLDSFIKSSKHT
ncbi:MAG: FAD-dependent oxidoreductase [Phycisphaerae bacterium]|nr:FAD-dependent oxidoreductase [Saprospiraceae bacterium]